VFTARYALSSYIKQIRFVFKGLIKVKSCNALLCMLMVCIRNYLKSVLGYKFLIFGHLSSGQYIFTSARCEDPWLFFEAKRGLRRPKSLGNTALAYGAGDSIVGIAGSCTIPAPLSAGPRYFYFQNVLTTSEAHPASCTVGTGVLSMGGGGGWKWPLTSV
jgi:hypothetical protein